MSSEAFLLASMARSFLRNLALRFWNQTWDREQTASQVCGRRHRPETSAQRHQEAADTQWRASRLTYDVVPPEPNTHTLLKYNTHAHTGAVVVSSCRRTRRLQTDSERRDLSQSAAIAALVCFIVLQLVFVSLLFLILVFWDISRII